MLADVLSRTAHPRVSLTVAAGFALLVAGVAVAAVDPLVAAETGLLALRVGFFGFLLLVFGVSGYVAVRVFETHPDA